MSESITSEAPIGTAETVQPPLAIERPARRAALILASGLLAIWTFLSYYSQTSAFVWDEGYHLIAAQQIALGKTPYIDFCFPQTPLNAYWNAFLIHIFGQHWQAPHMFAALFSLMAAALTAEFIFATFPVRHWRLPCALTAAAFIGLNSVVIEFGTISQAYGISLLLSVAAFRVIVRAVESASILRALAAGVLAGAAAGCTLLTAPVAPVLLLWLGVYNRVGHRWAKCAAFISGTVIPFIPVMVLYVRAPAQVFFNVVQYHALYRRADWTETNQHDFDVLSGWVSSTQVMMLGLLAIAGGYFVYRHSNWDRARRAEFYLAAWLSIALGAYISTPHPTFGRYFVFLVPFLALLAAAGLFSVGSKLAGSKYAVQAAAFAIVLMVLTAVRERFDQREATTWGDYEAISAKIAAVTPPGARLLADELVYFALQRSPPSGMELSYSHQIRLPLDQEPLFHIVSTAELAQQVKEGKFSAVESCEDDTITRLGLPGPFAHKTDVKDCSIFWGLAGKGSQ